MLKILRAEDLKKNSSLVISALFTGILFIAFTVMFKISLQLDFASLRFGS